MIKKLVYCVDTTDNVKIPVCVFNESNDKEKLADAINKAVKAIIYFEDYEDQEIENIGRGLAYGFSAEYHEYEFGIEDIQDLVT